MEFTNKALTKMDKEKKRYNPKYASWFYGMAKEEGSEIVSVTDPVSNTSRMVCKGDAGKRFFNKGDRIGSCLDFWHWHKYEANKLLDLQKVNRCKDRAFCPNCKMLNVSRFIHEFRQLLPGLLENYDLYMLTLTVPSVPADDSGDGLKAGLNKLADKFRRFNRKFSAPLLTATGRPSAQALQDRLCTIVGGIRVLEITYSSRYGFHPHYHNVACVPKGVDPALLEKVIPGKFSHNRKTYNKKSAIDVQMGKVWTMLWYDIDFRLYDRIEYDPKEKLLALDGEKLDYKCLEVDFRPLDDDGIYEVFKYTFKNSEIGSFRTFKNLVFALDGKRFRQGFGCLHNVKCDEFDEGQCQDLTLDIPEAPADLVTREINSLITEYADYKKVSRFNKGVSLDDMSISD